MTCGLSKRKSVVTLFSVRRNGFSRVTTQRVKFQNHGPLNPTPQAPIPLQQHAESNAFPLCHTALPRAGKHTMRFPALYFPESPCFRVSSSLDFIWQLLHLTQESGVLVVEGGSHASENWLRNLTTQEWPGVPCLLKPRPTLLWSGGCYPFLLELLLTGRAGSVSGASRGAWNMDYDPECDVKAVPWPQLLAGLGDAVQQRKY